MDHSTRFSVAETPTQSTFTAHRRARSHSQSSTPIRSPSFRRFSFLSLTPSPKSTNFAQLIDSEDKGYNPVYIFEQLSPAKLIESSPPKGKPFLYYVTRSSLANLRYYSLFVITAKSSLFTSLRRIPMPSWSISSKSSSASSYNAPVKSSKTNKTYRPYMPQPFFNAVAEYQLLNGGAEKSAIKAVLRERGLTMSVEEAIMVFGNESVNVGGNTSVHGGAYRDSQGQVWMDQEEEEEYTQLIPGFDDSSDTSSADSESIYRRSGSHRHPSHTVSGGVRHRPAPLQLHPGKQYGFDDNFAPTPRSSTAASFVSTAASSTLYAPSMTSTSSGKSSKSGVKSMFKMGRK